MFSRNFESETSPPEANGVVRGGNIPCSFIADILSQILLGGAQSGMLRLLGRAKESANTQAALTTARFTALSVQFQWLA
jgi:hypothetical protein